MSRVVRRDRSRPAPVRSRLVALGLALVLATPLVARPADAQERGAQESRAPESREGAAYRGRLGVAVQPMTPELRQYFGAPAEHGVLVVGVVDDLPARAAGLQVGDVLVRAGGEPLESPHDLIAIVARAPTREPVVFDLVSRGETRSVEVVPSGEPLDASAVQALHEGRRARRRTACDAEILRRLDAIEKHLAAPERPAAE